MSPTQVLISAIATFIAGGGALEGLRWIRGRRSDEATLKITEIDAATKLNAMALGLLTPYERELEKLGKRLDGVEIELRESREEQNRITGLFQQAISALRDFLDISIARQLPTPTMSTELLSEIGAHPLTH